MSPVRRGPGSAPQGRASPASRAGGAMPPLDPTSIICAPLADGEQVLVPGRDGHGPAADGAYHLNSATAGSSDASASGRSLRRRSSTTLWHTARHIDRRSRCDRTGPSRIDNLRGLSSCCEDRTCARCGARLACGREPQSRARHRDRAARGAPHSLSVRRRSARCRGALLVALGGLWWASAALMHSTAKPRDRRSGRVVVTPTRAGRTRCAPRAASRGFNATLSEPVLLELPLGRSPPQGAVIDARALVREPPGPSHGFDERTWLRRHGMHVVLRAATWRIVGHRGGLGGFADRIRHGLARAIAPRLAGERRAVLEGIVLGDDSQLSDGLRQDFRRRASLTSLPFQDKRCASSQPAYSGSRGCSGSVGSPGRSVRWPRSAATYWPSGRSRP